MVQKHYVDVEDFTLPAPLAGHPVLDFCNTRAGWNGAPENEYLQRYDHLAAWTAFAGLLAPERVRELRAHARRHEAAAAAALQHARQARRRVYRALLDPGSPEAVEACAADVRTAMARMGLSVVGGTPQWRVDEEAGLTAPLVAVMWSAAQLLTAPEARLVRACPGDGCGWLFLDRSGRRRWCTMAICGNRNKARRFAHAHRQTTAPSTT